MKIVWKYSINGKYKNMYRVNNFGAVQCCIKMGSWLSGEKIIKKGVWRDLKQTFGKTDYTGQGYYSTTWEGKRVRTHVLICTFFHGKNPTKKHQVNHKDGDRSNNSSTNLEWVTAKSNMRNAVNRGVMFGRKSLEKNKKITNEFELADIAFMVKEGYKHREIADIYSFDVSNVSKYRNGRLYPNYHSLIDKSLVKQ